MNDKMKRRRKMHERTTNLHKPEKGKKTNPSAEASNLQGTKTAIQYIEERKSLISGADYGQGEALVREVQVMNGWAL
jgi:hypothetical protein